MTITVPQELKYKLAKAKREAERAQGLIDTYKQDPRNNTFASLQDAEWELEDELREQAAEDCEGSYNCGSDKYTQGFFIGEQEYLATLNVEYNRHDKQYYFIECANLTITEVNK